MEYFESPHRWSPSRHSTVSKKRIYAKSLLTRNRRELWAAAKPTIPCPLLYSKKMSGPASSGINSRQNVGFSKRRFYFTDKNKTSSSCELA